jgi:hypothetical protein
MSTRESETRSAAAKKSTVAKKGAKKAVKKALDFGLLPKPSKPSISKTADEILLGIIRESPYYSPIHEAIRKPILQLLIDLGVRPPGGDGEEPDPIPRGK